MPKSLPKTRLLRITGYYVVCVKAGMGQLSADGKSVLITPTANERILHKLPQKAVVVLTPDGETGWIVEIKDRQEIK